LSDPTGVAVADAQPARAEGGCHERDEKAAIDEIANALQVINLLSTRLRQDLGESAQQAIRAAPVAMQSELQEPGRFQR
jgi:hypothetical protein